MKNVKPPLILVAGPTAVGKSSLSIKLAQLYNGAVISADSVQVYKKMNIGSAKVTADEMQGIDHYLIDILEPWEPFNITVFQEYAKSALQKIYSENKVPIIAGGTGFYIQSVVNDIAFTENEDDNTTRKKLEAISLSINGPELLYHKLCEIDPKSAELIHPNNIKRVIRAIEFFELTGKKISEHNEEEHRKISPYETCFFVITDTRENLYRNIDLRVDKMIREGLVEEVDSLIKLGCNRTMTSMQGLGYKEIYDYLNRDISLEEAIYIIKRDTRHFAKRQLTWFKREKNVIWLDRSLMNEKELLQTMGKHIEMILADRR